MNTIQRFFVCFQRVLLSGTALLVVACAGTPSGSDDLPVVVEQTAESMRNAWAIQSANALTTTNPASLTSWQHYKLPGKRSSEFEYAHKEGRAAIGVRSSSAASMLRLPLRVAPGDLGFLRFSWHVPQLIAQADMALREADDGSVRIVLAFEGDRAKFSAKNAMLNELARAVTGEEIPYATLMYVWCNKRPVGTLIQNGRTDRVRKLVVQSGPAQLDQWLDYERDVRADYLLAFGEEPGALVGIAIMTDTDNTQSSATAWYGPLSLKPTTVLEFTIK